MPTYRSLLVMALETAKRDMRSEVPGQPEYTRAEGIADGLERALSILDEITPFTNAVAEEAARLDDSGCMAEGS